MYNEKINHFFATNNDGDLVRYKQPLRTQKH